MKRSLRHSLLAVVFFAAAAAAAPPTETVPWSSGVPISYDGSGNIVQIGNDAFYYDNVSRLVQAKVNNDQRTYEYDAFGNRTKCITSNGGDCQNGLNIRQSDNRIGGANYDAAGNVIGYAGIGYTYDEIDMLARENPPSGVFREHIYTADDQRIATYSAASWNWTVRDAKGAVLREFTSGDGLQGLGTNGWTWTHDYVYRDNVLLASRQPATNGTSTYHYHLDQLGTPRRITDNGDQTAGFHDYYAFGPETAGSLTESNGTKLKYTGHERDLGPAGESYDTLDYMHARFYNPTLGRFFSVDTILSVAALNQPQRWNRYAYAYNSPMVNADPTGKLVEARAGECDDISTCYYTRLDAFEALKEWVGGEAAKHLVLNANGRVTLDPKITLREFAKLGPAATILANLMSSTTRTAAFALSRTVTDDSGRPTSAFTRPEAHGTLTEINPGAFPRIEGGVIQTIDTAMAHDLGGHALMDMFKISPTDTRFGSIDQRVALGSVKPAEAFAVTKENEYRHALGLDIRTFYFFKYDYDPPPGAPRP